MLGALYVLLLAAAQALTSAATTIYVTVMYIDQRRRNEMVAAGIPLRFPVQAYPQPFPPGHMPGAMGFVGQVPPPAAGQYPPPTGMPTQYPAFWQYPADQYQAPEKGTAWGPLQQTPLEGERPPQGDAPKP